MFYSLRKPKINVLTWDKYYLPQNLCHKRRIEKLQVSNLDILIRESGICVWQIGSSRNFFYFHPPSTKICIN